MIHITAMRDELEKIAFETGDERPFTSTRSGSTPISVEKLIEKNIVAKAKFSSAKGTLAAGAALGALGLHVTSKANRDRKLGREIRKQQQAQGQQGY